MPRLVHSVLLAGAVAACGCAAPEAPADLILLGGRVVTLDDRHPEARALAARDGRIVAIGSEAEVERWRGPETEVIELGGMLAVPGFVESHGHFTGIGRALRIVDLRGARSWDEVVERVARAAAERAPGAWVLGRGWHQEKWATPPRPEVEGYPTHERLSAAVPDHPVWLTHASGHAALVNALALARASVGPSTPDPDGGAILRDRRGRPTGLLRETAVDLVRQAHEAAEAGLTADQRLERSRREIELAARECLSKGVTSFHDAGSDFATVELLREMIEADRVGLRLWVMLSEDNDALERRGRDFRMVDAAGGMLTVRAIKRVLDGALGTHGAWLLAPYADLPTSSGLNTYPLAELERAARIAVEQDLQLCVHAIGDRANRETLDVFERVLREHPTPTSRRWRIEHAQHLHPGDVPRFAELGVIASMQAVHCTSDGPWVPRRIGEQRAGEGAYLWRALIDSGATLINGTDAPVEDVDPIANFHASVTRRMRDDVAFYPEQRMTRLEALRSMTRDAAYAAFEEQSRGSLAVGKLADVTVLSRDILAVPENEILDARVVFTIVGGRVAYRAPAAATRSP